MISAANAAKSFPAEENGNDMEKEGFSRENRDRFLFVSYFFNLYPLAYF